MIYISKEGYWENSYRVLDGKHVFKKMILEDISYKFKEFNIILLATELFEILYYIKTAL